MFFLATASLLGGLVHQSELDSATVHSLIDFLNTKMPSFLDPLSYDEIHTRLWFVSMQAIGLTEFYFLFLFIEPIAYGKLAIVRTWLKISLFIFFVVTLISSQYFFIVSLHVFTNSIAIIISLIIYFTQRIKPILLLSVIAGYNIMIGVMQQLMMHGILPTGPLHYNDWYHIALILMIVLIHWALTRGHLIESLQVLHVRMANQLKM